MDAREGELNTRRFDTGDVPSPAPGRGYAAVEGTEKDDPAAIKGRIDRTRADMDETVDALQEKLSIDNLKSEAVAHINDVKDRLVERVSCTLNDTMKGEGLARPVVNAVKNNPIPAAIAGIGITWLLIDQISGGALRRSITSRAGGGPERGRGRDADWLAPGAEYFPGDFGGQRREGVSPGLFSGREGEGGGGESGGPLEHLREGASGLMDRAQDIGENIQEGAGRLRERAGDAAQGMGDRARGLGGAISGRASRLIHGAGDAAHRATGIAQRAGHMATDATGRVRGAVNDLGNRAGQLAGSARATATQVGQTVGKQAERLGQTAKTTYGDYPLAVGAGVLCLGILLGLSMPSTPVEDKLRGEASDELAKKARKLGEQALEGGKRVAQAAVNAVQEETGPIDTQNAVGEVIGKVRGVVGTAVNAAKDEALSQGQKLAGVAKKEGMTDIPKMGFDTGNSGGDTGDDFGRDEGDRDRGF
jgi:hypothetical protein